MPEASRRLRRAFATAAACCIALQASVVSAESDEPTADAAPAALAQSALEAQRAGSFSKAIGIYENLVDRGFKNAPLAVNRALAYLGRAEGTQSQGGDLGQAIAALLEAKLLAPDDSEVSDALEPIRHEISRRRARGGADPIVVGPSLRRAVVALVNENSWAFASVLGSALLSVGMGMRLWWRGAGAKISAALCMFCGATLLLVGGSMALAARHFRTTSQSAVVIAEEARLLDARGIPATREAQSLEHVAVPEGAQVYVLERKGTLARIAWGTNVAWLPTTVLRLITR